MGDMTERKNLFMSSLTIVTCHIFNTTRRKRFERREPRCRICRDETVRVLVNKLLDWHGAPIILARGKTHAVTYADILRELQPLNEGRTRRTGSPMTASGCTPRGITTLPG